MNEQTWEPTGWWRVTDADGGLWCETSSEAEARRSVRPGDTLEQHFSRTDEEWRRVYPAEDKP